MRLISCLVLLAASAAATAATYELHASAVTAGGGHSSSGRYELDASLGQSTAHGPAVSPRYELTGGLRRQRAAVTGGSIFHDGFE